jgi:hypothetical protein
MTHGVAQMPKVQKKVRGIAAFIDLHQIKAYRKN